MSFHGLRGPHVRLIAKTHTKYSIRGGTGLVFALMALLTGLIIASIFVDPINQAKQQADAPDDIAEQIIQQVGRPAIKWATDASDTQLDYWMDANPALITAFMLLFMMFLPFLVALGASNQLSGDIGNRGIRYQLLRTERANLFLGRMVGTYLFGLIIYLVLFLIVAIFFLVQLDFYSAGDTITWLTRGFLAVAVYSLPYVALCAWISCAIDSAFGSLALTQLAIGFWPLLVNIGARQWEPFENAGYLMPWVYRSWLFDPSIGKTLAGIAVMLAFTALFTFLGLRHFEKRDL